MRFIDYLHLAFKNIGRQKLRSALTIFAVVIGATSVTVMLALVTGAKSFVKSQFETSGTLQQVIVTQATDLDYDGARFGGGGNNGDGGVKLTDDIVAKVAAVPHVSAVTYSTNVHVFEALLYKDQKLSLQNTLAYEPNSVIRQITLAGRPLNESDTNGNVTITTSYADKLGFKGNYQGLVDQTLTLRTQNFYTGPGANVVKPDMQNGPGQNNSNQQSNQPPQQSPTDISAKVVGVIAEADSGPTVYFPMKWARELLVNNRWEGKSEPVPQLQQPQQPQPQQGKPGQTYQPPQPPKQTFTLVSESELDRTGYQTITVRADNTRNVEQIANSIRTFGVGAVTAKSYVNQQLTILNIVGLVLGGIGGIALVVAAIGVINTMIMATLERTREIGVMRACGATRRAVRRLFTFEASLLGFWGGVVGLVIGYGLTLIANVLLNDQLKGNGIDSSNLITLPLWLIATVLGITTVIGLLAGLYPASRAARLNPVEALRHE